jgi:hypothetical protein
VEQISDGKQRETEDSTPKIEVMTSAMLKPPAHSGEQVEGFADVSEND